MFGALLLLAASQAADPLAEARAGKYQCVVPNEEKRTCLGTTSYKVTGNTYESTTRIFLAPTPPITMELHTTGAAKDGKLCETVRLTDFQGAIVLLNNAPADEATSNAVKSQLTGAVAALDGKMACSTIKPAENGQLFNEVAIDGTVRPDLSQKFIWVKPEDGYTLGQ
ncbi:hypothetical protein IAG41_05180 [Sphingomonas sp. JC676]|uniref:hypothetical protein n=1 Tax=Sphingomonas sp. JC676 TaxID=2768065 RepID=UPI0016578C7A|nr:hypothetical protein [Sphingomonas sp. JC676]MBC9031778.1 hypothetical protein [Sphingomonas sp. JC676]